MKCRRINPENGMIVWFGVKDIRHSTEDTQSKKPFTCGSSVFCGEDVRVNEFAEVKNIAVFENENDKHDNYAEKEEAVINSLRQRLSVIKHELWYDYNNGMPLTDKVRSKATIDAYIAQTVLKHPDVIDIEGFESEQIKNDYSCYMIVDTIYGQIEFGI